MGSSEVELYTSTITKVLKLKTRNQPFSTFKEAEITFNTMTGKPSRVLSSWGRCSRLMSGTSGTRSGGLRKGQSPCEFLQGLSGFLSSHSRDLRPSVESGPEPEDSSPVLTWILGYFWSLPRGVSPRLECGHALGFPPER